MFVPPNDLDDAAEIQKLVESTERFQNHSGKLYPHPGFGHFDQQSLEKLHAMHAAHHLGFLEVAPNRQAQVEAENNI